MNRKTGWAVVIPVVIVSAFVIAFGACIIGAVIYVFGATLTAVF